MIAGDTSEILATRPGAQGISSRWCGALTKARLELYGYGVAAIYAAFLLSAYNAGTWILNHSGVPIYTDFACAWIAAVEAVHGQAALLYDPAKFVEIQATFVGQNATFYPVWPYPPTFFLIMAPFAVLRYLPAFIAWDAITLLGCIVVVYAIVRRPVAIALVLASPFTAWNFLAGQNGLLTASLLGAALLFLERRPVLAGVFIGCLTYKPQFGILLPVALCAAKQWRSIASAAVTAALLAGAAAAAFGPGVWEAFPRELTEQAGLNLFGDDDSRWGYLQTVYGWIRVLHSGSAPAWVAQAAVTVGLAIIVGLVWRSPTRFPLKAATLSAAALIASPYAFAYDMAAIAIPAAFLARDQISDGFLPGEQATAVALFAAAVAVLFAFGDTPGRITFGATPTGLLMVLVLLCAILRRAFSNRRHPAVLHEEGSRQLSAMADRGGIRNLAR
jgi:arabinofuranan 3-O-arabinosyltransferase